jgi:LytS/YehU family sensor histidine kinase
MMSSLVLIMVLNLISLVRKRTRLPKQAFFSCLAGILPMTITMCIHMFVPVFQLFGIGIAICALSMFGIILSYQVEQYMLHQREIANQRASIMVLQMRPHFIYNTMMSIYYLCDLDSKKAQQVTLDFTSYLRKNFTAIASQETIPFSEELEHTRAYLAVEQAQFEENLFVDFDTPHTRFFLPPLTLQPIVENAVKHGMDPDSDPLRISIRTLESDSGSVIIVENNGLNFSPEENNEPHIALANIRERLETMCRGKMSILPRAGGGTSVRIWIPEQRSR